MTAGAGHPAVAPAAFRQDDEEFLGDYEALRRGVGAYRVDRDLLRVRGTDALDYLQGQCSQDVARLETGGSADALVLTPQGKLDALVRVTRVGEDDFVVDVDGGFGRALADRLARFKLRVKVAIEPLGWRCVALRGATAATQSRQGAALPGTARVAAFSWNGVVGVDLLGEDPAVPPGARACGATAWEALRVEAGIPRMGSELDQRTIAAEAGLLERCVSFTKGCYTGQELIARLDARGNQVARRLVGIVFDAPSIDGAARVVPGAAALAGEKSVGSVTSAAWSPALQAPIALAYLHRSVPIGSVVVLDGEGETVAGEVRELPLVS